MAALGMGASLALRWRPGAARVLDLSEALPPGAMFSRASAATRVDANGRVATEAAHVPRFDHDPISHARRGMLIEAAATNLALNSAAFDSAAWTSSGSAIVADAGAAPDGSNGADRLNENATTGQHRTSQTIATTPEVTYALSMFVRAAERSRVRVRVFGTGTVISTSLAIASKTLSVSNGSGSVVEHADGWFRLMLTGVADTTSSAIYINLLDEAGGVSFAGVPDSGLLVWGAQFEAGAGSSYIATGAGAATRAADQLTLDWSGFGIADGPVTLRYTFDDASSQDVATMLSGGKAIVPTDLARPRVMRAAIL